MRKFATILIALSLSLSGCSIFNSSEQNTEQATASEPSAEESAPLVAEEAQEEAEDAEEVGASPFSREGLVENPNMEELQKTADPEFGTPGTTEWRAAQMEIPDSLARAHADSPTNPGTLLVELSRELRLNDDLGGDVWEQTFRVHQEDGADSAEGVILRWGLKDDSLVGMDLRAKMSVSDDNWFVEGLEERAHCRRGVSDGMCI